MSNHEKTTKIKNESVEKLENSVSPETSCCDARCKICSSSHLQEIHNLKKAGHTFDDIVRIAFDKLKFSISKAGLSRHFTNYQKQVNLTSAKIINNDIIEDATKQAIHTKKLVALIDKAFETLEQRSLFDIADLEKLMKLRYQVMSGQEADENDILAIFQKATDKYGVNLQQGVLFKSPLQARAEQEEGLQD